MPSKKSPQQKSARTRKMRERSNRVMRPMRDKTILRPLASHSLERVYLSREGLTYGVRVLEATKTFPGKKVLIFQVTPKGLLFPVGGALLVPKKVSRSIQIDNVTRTASLVESSSIPHSAKGIGVFTPVLEEAIHQSRKQGWHKVSLECEKSLIPYYQQYGFKNKGKYKDIALYYLVLDFSPVKNSNA